MTKRRKLTFALLALLLLLAGVSVTMRVSDPAPSSEIALRQIVAGQERYCSNPRLGELYGSAPLLPFAFDIEKPSNTYRIFVLGGSVARGTPDPAYNLGRFLEVMLSHEHPDTHFEAINLGLDRIDAEGLTQIAQSCARYQPDLIIVYFGHGVPSASFASNLRQVCQLGTDAGAQVLLSTLASNHSSNPPFASQHRPDLTAADQQTWAEHYRDGFSADVAGAFDDALEHYLAATAIDDSFAELQYRVGRCHDQLEQFEAARASFSRALEVDAMPLRATPTANQVVPEIAVEQGVRFVDASAEVAANSPEETPGRSLFYDHIHLRFEGQYFLARAMRNVIADLLPALGEDQTTMGLADCAARLAYSDLDRYEALRKIQERVGQPPFSAPSHHSDLPAQIDAEAQEVRQKLDPILQNLMRLYRVMIDRHPEDWQLRWKVADFNFRHYKNNQLASFQAEKILESLPHPGARQILMRIATQEGRLEDAKKYALGLIADRPKHAGYRFDLGEIYKLRGDYEEAIAQFREGIDLRPGNPSVVAYTYLAELHQAVGRPGKAIDILYEGIKDFPIEHAANAYIELGLLLADEKRDDEAIDVLRTAIATFPAEQISRQQDVMALLLRLGQAELAAQLGIEPAQ
ncbi:MAG: tetratricopeptide (TPR) repeat protein [Rhodothermales bacterium]|jgi:tetratricopeptide (TPR) repeat protein